MTSELLLFWELIDEIEMVVGGLGGVERTWLLDRITSEQVMAKLTCGS
jgi:hypothetical protein